MVDPKILAGWLRDTGRPPLPPGDPVSWAVLTEGTLLEGAAWRVRRAGAAPLQELPAQ